MTRPERVYPDTEQPRITSIVLHMARGVSQFGPTVK